MNYTTKNFQGTVERNNNTYIFKVNNKIVGTVRTKEDYNKLPFTDGTFENFKKRISQLEEITPLNNEVK